MICKCTPTITLSDCSWNTNNWSGGAAAHLLEIQTYFSLFCIAFCNEEKYEFLCKIVAIDVTGLTTKHTLLAPFCIKRGPSGLHFILPNKIPFLFEALLQFNELVLVSGAR